jgi:hypothetical protein
VNVAQRLHITASPHGVSVSAHGLSLGLRLQAIGAGDELVPVSSAAPVAHANRIVYDHKGVVESYTNGPLGLEQSFTVTRSPGAGAQASAQAQANAQAPLTLAIALSGNARAHLSAGARSVQLAGPHGAVRIAGLSASDANGRALHAWMALENGQLLLRVDARGARFPLRIDPVLEEVAEEKLKLTGDDTQRVGMSVALSADGSTALVGGPHGHGVGGAVWVFERKGDSYQQQEVLSVPNAEDASSSCAEHAGENELKGCSFGSALALSANGNVAVVGAPHTNDHLKNGETIEHAGAAFVFTRSGTIWSAGTKLPSPEATAKGLFGRSVAVSANGETLLVGAPGEDGEEGEAWAFTGAGATWTPLGEPLLVGSGDNEAHFGASVALSADGKTALVGAPQTVIAGQPEGAAWVFERLGGHEGFIQGEQLTGAGENPEDRFGFSVALSGEGNTALIGAPDWEAGGKPHSTGAAWTFTRSGQNWSELTPKLTGEDQENELFAYSVALAADGDTAIVGAPKALEGKGDAWVYERAEGGVWGEATRKLVAQEAEEDKPGEEGKAHFGTSVASAESAESLLIGAPANAVREGGAWVVGGGPTLIGVQPKSGPANGGTVVTIEGQHFSGAEKVRFGGSEATSFVVDSATEITAVSPPGTRTVSIIVTTPFGASVEENLADHFTYIAPSVTKLKPKSGKPAGGEEVKIYGQHLAGATAVRFGANAATSFEVHSEGAEEFIEAVSPAGSEGTAYVTVVTPEGESEASDENARFTYVKGTETAKTGGSGGGGSGGSGNGNGSGGGSGGGSTTNGSSTASGGVLAAGPTFVAPACAAKLLSKQLLVSKGKLALLKLVGTGTGACRGSLRLRVKVKLHKRTVLKTIGTAVFSISAGKRRTLSVKLNGVGRALLKADHGHLNASLLIVKSSPAPSLARSASVRLTPQPPKRKAEPKT